MRAKTVYRPTPVQVAANLREELKSVRQECARLNHQLMTANKLIEIHKRQSASLSKLVENQSNRIFTLLQFIERHC